MTRKLIATLLAMVLILAACGNPTQPQAPFSLEPSTKNLEVSPGGVSSFAVNLKRDSGFTDTVGMTFEGLPDGISQRWSRDTENGDCTVQLSIDPETPEGDYSITLKGSATEAQATSQNVRAMATNTSSQTVTLSVKAAATSGAQGFTLSFSPTIVTVAQTNTVSTIATVTPVNGFNQDVGFSVNNLPANVSVVVDQGGPNNQFLQDKYKAFLRFTAGSNSVAGTYNVTVKAQSANFASTQTLQVKVFAQGSTTPTFDLFADAVNLSVRQDASTPLGLRVVRHNGYTNPIELSLVAGGGGGIDFVSNNRNFSADTTSIRITASNFAAVTIGKQPRELKFKALGSDGQSKTVSVNLQVIPKSGNMDSFGGVFGGLQLTVPVNPFESYNLLAGIPNQKYLVADNLKLRTFSASGTASGIFDVKGTTSLGFTYRILGTLFLPNAVNPIRTVGTLTAPGVPTHLAVTKYSESGTVADINTFNFFDSDARVSWGSARGVGNKTVISGFLDNNKCYLVILDSNDSLLVRKQYKMNASDNSSTCISLAGSPSGNSFFVGGQENTFLGKSIPIVGKFDLNGEPDKSFGFDGNAKLEGLGDTDFVMALAAQGNGKVLAGLEEQGTVARLNSNGQYDNTFGQNGIVKLFPSNINPASSRVQRIVLGANGTIFVLISDNSSHSSIAKLNSSGALQTDFSDNGFLNLDNGPLLGGVGIDMMHEPANPPTIVVLTKNQLFRFFQ